MIYVRRQQILGWCQDRLGEDCAPLHFLRELTQNSIEAVEALSTRSGEIRWDVDWNTYEATRTYKLAVIDTGIGMTGLEMVQFINHLSSSIREQSTSGNYGVGAKIATLPRNRAGVLYLSWKDGVGYQVMLWRDPVTNEYGLKKFEWPNGTTDVWAHVDDELKPEPIKDNGTMVVLFGNADDEDTMNPPEGTPMPSRWVLRYLNSRYFQFPDGIVVQAREGWSNPRQDSRHNFLRQVTGMRAYLGKSSAASGAVALSGATARWWILNDEVDVDAGHYAPKGHVAALYQDELYELQTSRAGTTRLQGFGVIFGSERVVIYVEPENGKTRRLMTNTARTHLLLDGGALPWAEWAEEFREKMPSEIRAFQDRLAAAVPPESTDAIRDRLKAIRDLFTFSRYRQVKKGPFLLDENSLLPGGVGSDNSGGGGTGDGTRTGGGGRRTGRGTGPGTNIYALFQGTKGVPGVQTKNIVEPLTRWISVETGTRSPGDLEDRAAKYLNNQHLILINADFRVFKDMVERWCKRYSQVKGARATVEAVVREWFEQQLIEAVLGAHALREATNQWTSVDIGNLWDEEALTAVVMPRYHVEMSVKRVLGARLGSLREQSA